MYIYVYVYAKCVCVYVCVLDCDTCCALVIFQQKIIDGNISRCSTDYSFKDNLGRKKKDTSSSCTHFVTYLSVLAAPFFAQGSCWGEGGVQLVQGNKTFFRTGNLFNWGGGCN